MNNEEHLEAAREIAGEGIVLLKNDNNVLPFDLNKQKNILVVGENAIKMMTVGGGSSSLKVRKEFTPLDGIKLYVGDKANIIYERGYVGDVTGEYNGVKSGQDLSENRSAEQLIADAVAAAQKADAVIFIGGLNKKEGQDCEGADRSELGLPYGQDAVIEALAAANKNLAVINISGNAVAMPWIEKVPSIMQGWFLGSESGNALAKVIFGEVNPSGHLPFTFPVKIEDNAAHAVGEWPGKEDVHYNESIFVGYRWADKEQIKALFPFGHGLSYTTFAVSEPTISKNSIKEGGKLTIKCKVTNTGNREGAEVVQLYIGDHESSLPRPVKELKGFKKLHLAAGESGVAEFTITDEDLKFFDDKRHEWVAEAGSFTAYIATSAEEILHQVDFTLK